MGGDTTTWSDVETLRAWLAPDAAIQVVYAGQPLQSRQRVYWSVTVWDDAGNKLESDPAWFELGLLNRSDWSTA